MDELPDHLVSDILMKIHSSKDRNSVSLSCKRFYSLDNIQRHSLRVGCGLVPANYAMLSLCRRFKNLTKVEINYSGWSSKHGKQLDDEGLLVLTKSCNGLTDLTLSYCVFITDHGIGYLSSTSSSFCWNLSSLVLDFAPRITGFGVLSLAVGCKKLERFHLNRCLNVSTSVEWLEYFGKVEALEEICIKNCRGVGERDLLKLGNCLRKLRILRFEVDDANHRKYIEDYDHSPMKLLVGPCYNLVDLSLTNCIVTPRGGLACVLNKCTNLEKLHLDMCTGVSDSDIVSLVQKTKHLKSITLRVPYSIALPDESLDAIARHCSNLECFKISLSDGDEFPPLFTIQGITTLIQKCPIRELSFDNVCCFNDMGMYALFSSARKLEILELVQCQEVSDEGLILARDFPCLSVLKLMKCMGVTDDGLRPFVGSHMLELLVVEDCPQVSKRGVHNAAVTVSFKQDLSWMF